MKDQSLGLEFRIEKLSKILLDKKCKSSRVNKTLMFSDDDHYHHPQGIREVHSINCIKTKKYSFLRRYLAKRELEKIYENSPNEEIKEKTKDILLRAYPKQNY